MHGDGTDIRALAPAEFDTIAQLALSIGSAVMVLSLDQLRSMLAQIAVAEAVGPIVDPTLYMRGAVKLDELRRLIAATYEYRLALEGFRTNDRT